jgi:Sap, sulfolipid-1-addressing protein
MARTPDPAKSEANVERMRKVADAPAITILAAGAVLANAGPFMLIALKNVSELNPSATQYIIDWIVFAVASLLPLGLALAALLVAPGWTRPRLAAIGGWVERHARAIAAGVMFALAISLLRDGIAAVIN